MHDLSPREAKLISMMVHARTLDMPDLIAGQAVRKLAEVIANNERAMSPIDVTSLICVGALLVERAEQEMEAGVAAKLAMGRAA